MRKVSEEFPSVSPSRAGRRDYTVPASAAMAINKELRVKWITNVMVADEWPAWPESLQYREDLATIWGVSVSSVKGYAAEAHRVVAIDPDEREQLRAEIAKKMKAIGEDAATLTSKVTGLPDFQAALKALNDYAKFAGIELETKIKLSGTVALEDLDDLRSRIEGDDNESEGRKG